MHDGYVRTSQETLLRYDPNRTMGSVGLLRWCINVTIAVLRIICRLVFYLKHDLTETGPGLRLQEEPTDSDHIELVCISGLQQGL
jgi:hypothetical protein